MFGSANTLTKHKVTEGGMNWESAVNTVTIKNWILMTCTAFPPPPPPPPQLKAKANKEAPWALSIRMEYSNKKVYTQLFFMLFLVKFRQQISWHSHFSFHFCGSPLNFKGVLKLTKPHTNIHSSLLKVTWSHTNIMQFPFNSLQFFPLNFNHQWLMDKLVILAVKKNKRT